MFRHTDGHEVQVLDTPDEDYNRNIDHSCSSVHANQRISSLAGVELGIILHLYISSVYCKLVQLHCIRHVMHISSLCVYNII